MVAQVHSTVKIALKARNPSACAKIGRKLKNDKPVGVANSAFFGSYLEFGACVKPANDANN